MVGKPTPRDGRDPPPVGGGVLPAGEWQPPKEVGFPPPVGGRVDPTHDSRVDCTAYPPPPAALVGTGEISVCPSCCCSPTLMVILEKGRERACMIS